MQGPGFYPWVGKIPWRRERPPTPVFWLGEFHGLYGPWGRKESDMTEWLWFLVIYTMKLKLQFNQICILWKFDELFWCHLRSVHNIQVWCMAVSLPAKLRVICCFFSINYIIFNVMCQLGWEGFGGRMDTCIYMAEFLCCSPETTTTLLIYYTPIQNKKFKVKLCNFFTQYFYYL